MRSCLAHWPPAALVSACCDFEPPPQLKRLLTDNGAHRAIKLSQLKLAFKHASRRCLEEQWMGKRRKNGKTSYVLLSPSSINLYDMASHVLLPATKAYTFEDGDEEHPSYVELVCSTPQIPDYFVSHRCDCLPFALLTTHPSLYYSSLFTHKHVFWWVSSRLLPHSWFEPVLDFIRCLECHAVDRVGCGSNGEPKQDLSYWVCAYANRQV